MKAHEETWNADACCGFVKNVAGNVVADVSLLTTEKEMEETTRLLSAAPDMARALLRRLRPECVPCICHLMADNGRCYNCEDRETLQKAGVLP